MTAALRGTLVDTVLGRAMGLPSSARNLVNEGILGA